MTHGIRGLPWQFTSLCLVWIGLHRLCSNTFLDNSGQIDTLTVALCSQLSLPLSNDFGVPFTRMHDRGIQVDGFDVDREGNLFFLGGQDATTLAKFSLDGRLQYRRIYDTIGSGQIRIYDNSVISFDIRWSHHLLTAFDIGNGDIKWQTQQLFEPRSVNSYAFCDSFIVVALFSRIADPTSAENLSYRKINISGQIMEIVQNKYGLSNEPYLRHLILRPVGYLGKFHAYPLFYEFMPSGFRFWLQTATKALPAKFFIPISLIGDDLIAPRNSGNPDALWVLRNQCLYIIGVTGQELVVTWIPMITLFPDI